MKKSLVYTKTGDKGSTSLIGGTRVAKNHVRLEAYGTIDELNSYLGMLRSLVEEEREKNILIEIQSQLFTIGAYLATDTAVSDMRERIQCDEGKIKQLEDEMDRLEQNLPPLTNFVLPGGHPAVSYSHICRTICRRAERRVIAMAQELEVDEWVIRYLNRLSDFLFVLSRHLSNYFGIREIPWDPKL
jgi:cob(I)alamin adenosyltransferase